MTRVDDLLLDTARRGELHHAVILHGPSAPTLSSLALRIARALNCIEGTTGDDCLACRKIEKGTHPDVHMVGVDENRKLIAVDQIREMIGGAAHRPYEGRTKVFIVEGAEAISAAGANAMLKTLEEPGRDTVFLLLTRAPDLLLPTIRSRAQSIAIPPPVIDPDERASDALRRLRDELLSLPGLSEEDASRLTRSILSRLSQWAGSRDTGALLGIASELSSETDPRAALPLLATVLRDLASRQPDAMLDPDAAAIVRDSIPMETLLRAAHTSLRNAQRLTVNADGRLLLEQALCALTSSK